MKTITSSIKYIRLCLTVITLINLLFTKTALSEEIANLKQIEPIIKSITYDFQLPTFPNSVYA